MESVVGYIEFDRMASFADDPHLGFIQFTNHAGDMLTFTGLGVGLVAGGSEWVADAPDGYPSVYPGVFLANIGRLHVRVEHARDHIRVDAYDPRTMMRLCAIQFVAPQMTPPAALGVPRGVADCLIRPAPARVEKHDNTESSDGQLPPKRRNRSSD